MNQQIDAAVGELIARLTGWSRRNCWPVLIAVVSLTVYFGWYASGNLGVDADMAEMVSAELPHRILEREYEKKFPLLTETMVVVIDGDTPERARDAASQLAERMRTTPEHFLDVYLPQGEFFEEHALLYLETDELEDFADRLARVQPYLAGLAKDGTLRGLADILARGVSAVRDGEIQGAELEPMFGRFEEAVRAQLRGERYQVSWAEVVAGHDIATDARRRFIVAQPVLDFTKILAAQGAIQAVRHIADELDLDEAHGVQVRMTGDVVLSYEEMLIVQRQVAIAGTVSFILVTVLLIVALRSFRLVLASSAMLLIGLVWTSAFAAAAVGHLNIISISVFVLFIGLGIDFAVHFCMRYQEALSNGETRGQALHETATTTGSSLVLCALTTAIGFYSFVPTPFGGVAELGLIAGTGMFICILLTFTLLPALTAVGTKATDTKEVSMALPPATLPSLPARHPRMVSTVALTAGVCAALLIPRITFDSNPLNVRDPSAESVQTFEELLADSNAQPWTLSAILPDLESAAALGARLAGLPEVDRAVTIADFVPQNQEEKLGILEDVALFLAPMPAKDGSVVEPTLAEQLEALRRLRAELARLDKASIDAELRSASARLDAALADFLHAAEKSADPRASVETLESSLLGSLPDQLRTLERSLSPGEVTLETLPQALVARMVSNQGEVRLEIYPSEDLNDNVAMDRFIKAVRVVTPDVTGTAVGVYEASQAAITALRQALTSAVIIIAILLFFIWRTVGDTVLVMTPLLLAAVLTSATAVLVGIPFNFADIVVLPLLLGIGVDSGIHLVHRWRLTGARADALLETSTAHAVIFSALTTIASFGSLAFTTHRGVASMGQLLAVGVGYMVICNLFILPAFIELRARRLQASDRG